MCEGRAVGAAVQTVRRGEGRAVWPAEAWGRETTGAEWVWDIVLQPVHCIVPLGKSPRFAVLEWFALAARWKRKRKDRPLVQRIEGGEWAVTWVPSAWPRARWLRCQALHLRAAGWVNELQGPAGTRGLGVMQGCVHTRFIFHVCHAFLHWFNLFSLILLIKLYNLIQI